MNIRVKRRCTYATIVLYNLCNGIAYAIVFPTIWNYVHERYGGNQSMFGFVIAAYSISAFVANPVVGYWGDKTQNTKAILSLAVLAEIIGSLMYFFGVSSWFLACSRLVSGLGGGGTAVVIADITRTTLEEDRTSVLALVVSSRQLGLLIGPGFNLFLSKLDFKIGATLVDKYTSPGLFMAVLWVIVECAVLFMYYNLTTLKDEEEIDNLFRGYNRENSIPQEPYQSDTEVSAEHLLTASFPNYSSSLTANTSLRSNQSSSVPNLQAEIFKYFEENSKLKKDEIKTTICRNANIPTNNYRTYSNVPAVEIRKASECSNASDNMMETAERFILSASESFREGADVESKQQYQGYEDVRRASEATPYDSLLSSGDEKRSFSESFHASFLRDEIVVVLGLSFFCAFAQTSFETIITPLVQQFYGFEEMENSIIYFCAGIEVILVFFGVRYASRKVSDRTMILFGIISLCIALGLPLLCFVNTSCSQMSTLPCFIIIAILDLFGISVVIVCISSLLSKLVDQDCQALAQGFRRSMLSLGCILGPLWGGSYLNQLYALFAVPLAVSCLIGILFLCSFKKMV